MGFGDSDWEETLPKYLLQEDKRRLKDFLSQFFIDEQRGQEIRYDNFYLRIPNCNYFRQGDILNSVPTIDEAGTFLIMT